MAQSRCHGLTAFCLDDPLFCEVTFLDDGADDGGKPLLQGNHTTTFLLYFVIRLLFNLFVNIAFNISDGAGVTIARREDSSYSVLKTLLDFMLIYN